MRWHPRLHGLVLGMLAIALAAACSGGDEQAGPEPEPRKRIDIDPAAYVEDYGQNRGESAGGSQTASAEVSDASSAVGSTPPTEPNPPDVTEDNTFVDPGEAAWNSTADDPQSTFGLDVDTGSFTVARRFAEEGYRAPPESIRPEEWINALVPRGEPRAATSPEETLRADAELAAAAYAGVGTEVLRVGVSTPTITPEDRPPVALTFVVDTSGSMDIRERLGLVKASLAILVLELRDDDTISIVTYGDEASALLEPTPVAEAQTIVDAIDALVPGGSTNMEAGLRTGYRQARDSFREDGVNAVILASDGVANVGVSDPDGLAGQIEEAGNDGIRLVTLGYGMGNYNDDLMEQLADQGDGFYRYLDTLDEAEKLFIEDLAPTLVPAADDAKIQVTFDPAVVEQYRLIGYQNRAIADEDFTNDDVDAGELGRGHHVTALYEIRRVDGATDTHGTPIGTADLRWADPGSGEVFATSTPLPEAAVDGSPHLRLAEHVAAAAEILAGEPEWGDRDVPIGVIAADARALADEHGLAGGDELADLLDTIATYLAPQAPPDDGP